MGAIERGRLGLFATAGSEGTPRAARMQRMAVVLPWVPVIITSRWLRATVLLRKRMRRVFSGRNTERARRRAA
jgi:hypothetical protein